MMVLQEIKRRAGFIAGPVLGVSLMCYFGYHLVQGERGLARQQGGLGIGLTLVKRLAELHKGAASASSSGPGQGSTFTVRFPAEAV